jgi:ribose transport system substrate-binding protein
MTELSSMTTFERRETIVRLIQERSSVHVTDLAKLLDVSEGTIRNDLTALEEEQRVVRVRGGAVLKHGQYAPSSLGTRALVNLDAKRRIARWAANMVEDGDAILLDASTTVLNIAVFLQDRRHLTVVTNGIEVARALAQNPTNTVILIGGVLRADSNALTGNLGESMLESLYVKTAFISCVGFTNAGLMEADMQQAQLKSRMLRTARRVVALVDASKFEQIGLVPFATLDQISQIVTDDDIAQQTIELLRQANASLIVCGEETVDSFLPHDLSSKNYRIGFANLSEDIPFAVDVRRSLERAAEHASNVDLVLSDNQLSGEIALNVADHLIIRGIDLMIEYQIDEKLGNLIINKFHQARIPVIAVDIPMVGATYFGVDNYRAGHLAGIALGNWINNYWNGTLDCLIVLEEPRSGPLTAGRIQGQINGLREIIGAVALRNVLYLDCGNTKEVSENQVLVAFETLPNEHRIAVICFNDDAALGALIAARRVKRESDVVIVGQGADRRVREEIRKPESRIIGSTAFTPERYGEKLMELALKILRGESVPPAVYVEHIFINTDNLHVFYPE